MKKMEQLAEGAVALHEEQQQYARNLPDEKSYLGANDILRGKQKELDQKISESKEVKK